MTESLAASVGVLCDHYAATLEAAHVERLDLRDRYEASDGKEAHLLLANLAWTVSVLGRMIALTEHILARSLLGDAKAKVRGGADRTLQCSDVRPID